MPQPIIVHRQHGSSYLPGLTILRPGERDLTAYAVTAYGYLLPRNGSYTAVELADAIEATYDCNEPRHREIVQHLRAAARQTEPIAVH